METPNVKLTIGQKFILPPNTRISLWDRIKMALAVLNLRSCKIEMPYAYYCNLIDGAGVCDNNRRKSKCINDAKVALANRVIELKYTGADSFYHVCGKCSWKYIGSFDGEEYRPKDK